MAKDSKDINERIESLYNSFSLVMDERGYSSALPQVVFIEQAVYVQNIKATLAIDAVINAVRFTCIRLGIPYFIIDNKSWKKDVLGNGNASKEDIMRFAKVKWGDEIKTQDEADAACIAMYGKRRFDK